MAKSMIDAPTKLKKIKPESGLQRRNSTGGGALIFSEPIPIPNYLRASIGSCHDLCKYGGRRGDASAESATRSRNMRPEAKSITNNRNMNMRSQEKSITNNRALSGTKNNSVSRKPEPLKSTCNARVINEGKRVKSLPRTISSLPESPVRIPKSRAGRSKSVPPKKVPEAESQKLLQGSECCKKSDHCDQAVEEKIIHVVETNDHIQNQNEDADDQNQLARNDDCCSRKLELKKEVSEAENREGGDRWKEIRLRRVVSEGDSEHMRRECMKIVVMGKNKVKALVHSFETLMNSAPDSEGSRSCSSSS